jgi:aromatic ring-cleaving dioxygenase
MSEITSFHVHVYFDAATMAQARTLCKGARDAFGVEMGRMHEKPVGPHPDGSCQLSVPPEKFGAVVPWLALNRDGLNVLVHPETGDKLKDHSEHALWMGEIRPLDMSIFNQETDA